MRLKAFLYMTVAVLPIALAGCTDSTSDIRAKYGDVGWSPEALMSTPYDRGSVHFTAETIDIQTYAALVTRSGGETVNVQP